MYVEPRTDHCKTAHDVKSAAQSVREKRRSWRMPKLVELVRRAEVKPQVEEYGPFAPLPARPILIQDIQRAICKRWRIDPVDFISHRRTRVICEPRHVSFVLCRALTFKSLPEIARRTGGRDHTTALSSIRKFGWLLDQLRAELTTDLPLKTWVNRAYELVKEKA